MGDEGEIGSFICQARIATFDLKKKSFIGLSARPATTWFLISPLPRQSPPCDQNNNNAHNYTQLSAYAYFSLSLYCRCRVGTQKQNKGEWLLNGISESMGTGYLQVYLWTAVDLSTRHARSMYINCDGGYIIRSGVWDFTNSSTMSTIGKEFWRTMVQQGMHVRTTDTHSDTQISQEAESVISSLYCPLVNGLPFFCQVVWWRNG